MRKNTIFMWKALLWVQPFSAHWISYIIGLRFIIHEKGKKRKKEKEKDYYDKPELKPFYLGCN